ncbi:MAG: hypothetical protein HDR37_11530 [Treponema sp.]|nr:hypothetical protein [Treponema sp.]
MGILFSDEILDAIYAEISRAKESVHIITAYCKEVALKELVARIPQSVRSKRLLVRFRLGDIVDGSTDFSILEYCLSHGWDVFIRFDLHAKTYIIDNERGIVGSANATASGLGLKSNTNYEVASLVDLKPEDMAKVSRLFCGSIKVTAEVFSMLKKQYDKIDKTCSDGETLSWDDSILHMFHRDVRTLFSHDFPDTTIVPGDGGCIPPFLDDSECADARQIKEAFRLSNCYAWLLSVLRKNGGCLYFGQLTAELHDALVEDPKPYRKDVKMLLANLLTWTQELHMEDIVIDMPRHSQRVRLT